MVKTISRERQRKADGDELNIRRTVMRRIVLVPMSSTHEASNLYFVFLLDQPNEVLSFPMLVDVADEQVYRIAN